MYEENKKFSWTNFFIKGIIVIIFILFAVWLLSLSNKGISNQLNVLTDNIFKENIDRMKEVGKSYFTTERLPQNVGEVKTLTLAKMYDEKLILEIKDKYGHACSATNSYVSVEKLEDEYQMKVYLECGEESDYIIVIMGCYDYCQFDICERTDQNTPNKQIEYEYKKNTGGKWTDYGSWSEWSKVSVTKTDYRQVETKVVKEEYTNNKTIIEKKYISDGTCPEVSGYTLVSKNNGTCTYKKSVTIDNGAVSCPTAPSGYTYVSNDGKTCIYTKNVTVDNGAVSCPTAPSGYTYVSNDGKICKYSKTVTTKTDALCPTAPSGYTYVSNDGNTCTYKKTKAKYSCPAIGNGFTYKSREGDTCIYTKTYKKFVSSCDGCAGVWQTVTDTKKQKANVSYNTSYETLATYCKAGYTKENGKCISTSTTYETKNAYCSIGTISNGRCLTTNKIYDYKSTYCSIGTISNGRCITSSIKTITKNVMCPTGQYLRDNKCYQDIETVVPVKETRNVTYYRYRIRQYIGSTVDYKWSKSKEDKDLLNAGYRLTGRTR